MLRRDECDNENVYRFLKLLYQNGRNDYSRFPKEINEQDQIRVVKQSKQSSASSIFSKRIYAMYKCALESEGMTIVLIMYYNILLKNGYFLK